MPENRQNLVENSNNFVLFDEELELQLVQDFGLFIWLEKGKIQNLKQKATVCAKLAEVSLTTKKK